MDLASYARIISSFLGSDKSMFIAREIQNSPTSWLPKNGRVYGEEKIYN